MWRIIGYITAGLLILVLIFGIGWKIIGKTEGYRAEEQNFYSFEPHYIGIGGCARYDAFKKGEVPAQNKQVLGKSPEQLAIKKEVKNGR